MPNQDNPAAAAPSRPQPANVTGCVGPCTGWWPGSELAFRVAYPDVQEMPRLPIRAAQGRDLLWVETLKPPVCLDADDQPIDPPEPGAFVKILFRACPWYRAERGQGVNAFLQKLKLAPMTSPAQTEAA